MPILNGLEASSILTEKMKNHEIPFIHIIACTANALDEDKDKCTKSGMNIHLIKPFSVQKIDDIAKKLN